MRSNRPVLNCTELYLDSMLSEFHFTGMKELFHKCNIYIAVKGNYVDLLVSLCVILNCKTL